MVDALACISDEGRSKAAISDGEVPSNLRPVDLRMRKLSQFTDYLKREFKMHTWGSKTFQYPEE